MLTAFCFGKSTFQQVSVEPFATIKEEILTESEDTAETDFISQSGHSPQLSPGLTCTGQGNAIFKYFWCNGADVVA